MGELERAPKDYQALRALIAQRGESLPKRLTQVAAYALENPDEIAFGTVASIAGNAEVQPSALVRFSRALGYQGFSELQEVFRSRLRERVLNYDERLTQMREHGISTSKSALVLDGFLEAAERSVAQMRDKVDHEAIDRAVDILAEAETIYLIGLRRSFPITSYMSYAMGK
ncbi:MAG TPA: MurR/RpiR family transcriptional regulator, partial [Mesorhizobium sp.]|nr:MurR/RpiR family transcriptional regulator [Mesorhizobium sp.]